jgi:hypothetical protein
MRTRNLIALALLAASASAHDFWIAPQSFKPQAASLLDVHLQVGEAGQGDEVQRSDERIRRFVALDARGETPIVGRDGSTPAGRLRLAEAGVATLGYHSTPKELMLPAEKFEAYLREEGLEGVIAERERLGERAADGREHYERCAKSLVSVGGAHGIGHTLGLPLEFVVLDESAGGLQLELRFEGKPLEHALVRFARLDMAPEGAMLPAPQRTGADGRVVAPSSGRWLVTAVHMQRAASDSGADWHSWWGSLTYER